jgi:SAM-dependent methyltransferase
MSWPLPALLAWAAAWGVFFAADALETPAGLAFALAAALAAALALRAATPWRRLCIGGGFPLSFLVAGFGGALSAWPWLVPLALLLVVYPRRAWRDAPLYPTPAGALRGLAATVPLGAEPKILDAGCGLGAGLIELRREYPRARLFGIEWSLPLSFACAWRCRDASIRRADLWSSPWCQYDLVYLFQRPESLSRAVVKAAREMRPGAWLASLEFEAVDLRPQHVLAGPDGRPVWLYRAPFTPPLSAAA